MCSKLSSASLIGVVLLIGCSIVLAEDSVQALGIDFSVDYVGKYIWRGQNLQDDGAFQPSVNFTYGGFSANIWGSMEMSNINDNSGEITEVDYSFDYSNSFPGLEGVDYSIGLINYTFPNTAVDDTTELYAGIALDLPLSPSITFYNDVDDVNGSYFSFGLGHSIESIGEISEGIPVGLDISANFGWGSASYNKAYWGVNDSEMNDFALSIAFPMELEGGWGLTPSFNYVTLMSGDIRDNNGFSDDDSFFYVGIGLSKSF